MNNELEVIERRVCSPAQDSLLDVLLFRNLPAFSSATYCKPFQIGDVVLESEIGMKKKRYVIFALVSVMLSILLTTGVIIGLDVFFHKRYEESLGLNVWGYRGPVVRGKRPGEQRVIVLGGSTVFGVGVSPEKSFPAYLERKLHDRQRKDVTIVNLGLWNEGAFSFIYTLRDYEYLKYELAIFYEGYNDSGETGISYAVRQHQSPIFRLSGYFPILPMILSDYAIYLRYRGDIRAANRGERTVFNLSIAERAIAGSLEASVAVSRSLERQLGRLSKKSHEDTAQSIGRCAERWVGYCNAVYTAVDHVLNCGKRVIVVTQPYISDKHVEQQRAMVSMLRERFGDHPRLWYVNLGLSIDPRNSALAFDGLHLTPTGNERIAENLVQPTLKALE